MGKAIADYEIGANAHAEFIPDAVGTGVWEDISLAAAGVTLTSGEFMLAQTMGGTEFKLVAGAGDGTNGLVTTTGPVTVLIKTSPTSGGTFDDVVLTEEITADTTFAEGADLITYIPPREQTECYAKVFVTVTTDTLTTYSLDAFVVGVC